MTAAKTKEVATRQPAALAPAEAAQAAAGIVLHCDWPGCDRTYPVPAGGFWEAYADATGTDWVFLPLDVNDEDAGGFLQCPDHQDGPLWFPRWDGTAREPGDDVVVLAAARQAQEWKRADEARQREQEAAFARSEQAWQRAITKDDPGTWTGIWGPKVTGSAAAAIDATVADMPLISDDAETVTFWGNDEPEPGRKYRASARTWWQWLTRSDEDTEGAA